MDKGRNYNLDLIKAISIILVCYTHFNNFAYVDITYWHSVEGVLGYILCSLPTIAVPLFFMVNGYLLFNKPLSYKKHIKKIAVLVINMMLWTIITNIVLSLFFKQNLSVKTLVSAAYHIQYINGIYSNSFWFFKTLFFLYLFFPVIKYVLDSDNNKLILYIFGIVFVFTFLNDAIGKGMNVIQWCAGVNIKDFTLTTFFKEFNPFTSWYSFSLCYFIAGGLVGKKNFKLQISNKVLALIVVVGFGLQYLYGLGYIYNMNAYYNNVWNGYSSVLIFAAVVSAFLLLNNLTILLDDNKTKGMVKKYIVSIGSSTFGIYFVHTILGNMMEAQYKSLPFYKGILGGSIYGITVFLLSYITIIIFRRIPVIKSITKI